MCWNLPQLSLQAVESLSDSDISLPLHIALMRNQSGRLLLKASQW